MPVTTHPSPELQGTNKDPVEHSPTSLLKTTSTAWAPTHETRKHEPRGRNGVEPETRAIMQSSFGDLSATSGIAPYGNGFINGIIRAFQQDLHLVLRPDDVWLAVLIQFSHFVNGHAEEMREHFVALEGEEKFVLDVRPDSLLSIGSGELSRKMAGLIDQKVVDSRREFKDWVMPDFSTTTEDDKVVASIVLMATLKEYSTIVGRSGCGFPAITLQGEKPDWDKLLRKVEQLNVYGDQPAEFQSLLVPVVSRMVATFATPDAPETKDFWLRAVQSAGSDASSDWETLSGWINAFAFWNSDGAVIREDPAELSSGWDTPIADRQKLVLDGVGYPFRRPGQIPKGVLTVPVEVEDFATMLRHEVTIVAGSVGMKVDEEGHVVQPRSGWWMLEDKVEPFEAGEAKLSVQDVKVEPSKDQVEVKSSTVELEVKPSENEAEPPTAEGGTRGQKRTNSITSEELEEPSARRVKH